MKQQCFDWQPIGYMGESERREGLYLDLWMDSSASRAPSWPRGLLSGSLPTYIWKAESWAVFLVDPSEVGSYERSQRILNWGGGAVLSSQDCLSISSVLSCGAQPF